MQAFLRERGPDGEGIWLCRSIGLVHTRLSIVDLSSLGSQPMKSIGGEAVITFNGEIYNFKDLRRELVEAGSRFRSLSDTEVLLAGYLVWGIAGLLERIDGMFAFALFDVKQERTFLCRDRFGKKPLYYFASDERVRFSSDIRSIARTEASLEIDFATVDYFLTELSSPQPRTIYKNVAQVRPGHYLVIDQRTRTVEEHRYWRLNFKGDLALDLEEAERLVEEALGKAVARRMHGDVPIGAFLSGGVDSGLVVALLARNCANRVKTFTVVQEGEADDEAPLAKRLAERYDTEHTELVVKPDDVVETIERLIDYCGEPFGDSSLIPSFYVCRAIAGSVKVALSGDGGDELFGGYYEYAYAYHADRYLRRASHRSESVNRASLLVNKLRYRFGLTNENHGSAVEFASYSGAERLHRRMGFSAQHKRRLYTPDFSREYGTFAERYLESAWSNANNVSLTSTLLEASLSTRLLNDYLVKVDRSSMINSLEVRSPFLDHHLASVAATIPAEHHLFGGTPKYLTKRIAQRYIGDDIFTRAKRGFGIPLGRWLRAELYDYVHSVLMGSRLSGMGIANRRVVLGLLEAHRSGVADHTDRIWALFCLERWLADHQQ